MNYAALRTTKIQHFWHCIFGDSRFQCNVPDRRGRLFPQIQFIHTGSQSSTGLGHKKESDKILFSLTRYRIRKRKQFPVQ